MIKVLFACVHNTGRSQMAEAFFNELADTEKARGYSGGIEPATSMNPTVLEVMQEIGLDLVAKGHRPKLTSPDLVYEMDQVYSMG